MAVIPWIFTAMRGAFIFSLAAFVINKLFGSDTISWYVLCFGIPSHVLADFAGFCNVVYAPSQKPAVLGPCYLGLLALAIACGVVLGVWSGLLVFLEGWVFGLPAGHHRTIRDLDKIQLAADLKSD
jgi:hypothetical protein